ncbi:PACE efflux transporter [Dysgonomonas sp. Marseille-P4361]|uniref:PACE efflux transporter n=1 Tax=Dysgonomonas sp. Marseille-P4361 TaxID=2161820 RepID=UPI000D5505AF|nr:PACE efflux transporter [Dysgonomonas sp. Marseille-P4361]
MKLIEHIRARSPIERSFHALSYEVVGIILSAPIISFVSGKPMHESGALAVVVSVIAMLWNYLFNVIFDKLQNRYKFKKNLLVRVLHGTCFEVGLILLTAPTIALIFSMTVIDAFFLEAGMLLFFFPYTIVFNWCYDKLRLSLVYHYDKTHPRQK